MLLLAQVQLLFFSLPVVADFLFGKLESKAAALEKANPMPKKVAAVVVLGGGVNPYTDASVPLPDLNDAADRIWLAARLYQQGLTDTIVVSGGGFSQSGDYQSEAAALAKILQDFSVPVEAIIQEPNSRTTLENAVLTQKILSDIQADDGVALVTSAFHLPRAFVLFKQLGVKVYPVRADVRVRNQPKPFWAQLPRADALNQSSAALREYLGYWQYLFINYFK